MSTTRCVKWSKEARDFFSSASDNSVVLDIVISHECRSQTGEGFEELVNSINSEEIKKKVKSVNILDTSYLCRHVIPTFAKYSNPEMPTEWSLTNKHSIEKLEIDNVIIRSWTKEINTSAFKDWFKQIMLDYAGDENGKGIVQEFRDLVIADSAVAAYKNNTPLENCIDFMLEECAHVCSNFYSTTNLVYPMKVSRSVEELASRYHIDINHLRYRTSTQTQNSPDHVTVNSEGIDREVALFMKEKVSNVNFFVMDRYGNHIYKNYAYDSIVGDINFGRLDPNSWKNSVEVMKTRRQAILEEEYQGANYLSVKAPLIINDKVEGVIGLAVDITDRKRMEQLEVQDKVQKEINLLSEQVAHDLQTPLAILSMFSYSCKELSEKSHIILRNAITSIRSIASHLLHEKNGNETEEKLADPIEQYISVPYSLEDIISGKQYQYDNPNITFNLIKGSDDPFIFIRGDFSNYCRMMSNLINNAIEAMEGEFKAVDIGFALQGQQVEIYVRDRGKGMPKETVDKILNNVPIGTTKKTGHGIGLQQIKQTVKQMNGELLIDSKEDEGTKFALVFQRSESPPWFVEKLILPKGGLIVVLDDSTAIHDYWRDRLSKADVTVKCFTHGDKAVGFINSCEDKRKVFLLADYELRHQNINGIEVIEQCNLQKQSVFMTSCYTSRIKDFPQKAAAGLKLLGKAIMGDVSVIVGDCRL